MVDFHRTWVWIDFGAIDGQDRTNCFRDRDPEAVKALALNMSSVGQMDPMVLERTPENRHIIQDGFGRYDAIASLRTQGQEWTRVKAIVYGTEELTLRDRFAIKRARNDLQGGAYDPQERCRLYVYYVGQGMTHTDLASQEGVSVGVIGDYIKVANCAHEISEAFFKRQITFTNALTLWEFFKSRVNPINPEQANREMREMIQEVTRVRFTTEQLKAYLNKFTDQSTISTQSKARKLEGRDQFTLRNGKIYVSLLFDPKVENIEELKSRVEAGCKGLLKKALKNGHNGQKASQNEEVKLG